MRKSPKKIGLAIVGAGRVGLIRGEVAARHPEVEWIGIAEKNPDRAKLVGDKIAADFVTSDFHELLKRPEVNAAIVSTDEHLHVGPVLAAVERGIPLLVEKPLATQLAESQRVLDAIERAKVDAVIGYTQRFRRRWLVAKEKVRTGALGDVTMVTSRAFMNRWWRSTTTGARPTRPRSLPWSSRARTPRHGHVADGNQDPGRGVRAVGQQGARPDLERNRRDRVSDQL